MANKLSKNNISAKRSGKYRIAANMNRFKINKKIAIRHSFYKKKCQCMSCAKKAKLWRKQINEIKRKVANLGEFIKTNELSDNSGVAAATVANDDANYNGETNDTTDCTFATIYRNTGLWQQITNDSGDNNNTVDAVANESVFTGESAYSSDSFVTDDGVSAADEQTSGLDAKLIELVTEIKRMGFSETCDISVFALMALLRCTHWNVAVARDLIIKGIQEFDALILFRLLCLQQ